MATTDPMLVWFSAALKVAAELITGAISFTLVTNIVISLEVVSLSSLTDKVIA